LADDECLRKENLMNGYNLSRNLSLGFDESRIKRNWDEEDLVLTGVLGIKEKYVL
jgi:hypothetical protein